MNPRVQTVTYKSPYRLILFFTNGEQKEFDFSPYLSYPVFEQLRNESFCRKVKVTNGIVAWNDEIDFDPDTLYIESKLLNESHSLKTK